MLTYSSLCFWPLAHLQSENKKTVIKACLKQALCGEVYSEELLVPHSDKICFHLRMSVSIYNEGRNLCLWFCLFFKVVLPLPKCLHAKASPRIICPHRNIHPHPVSDVGPVPPVAHSRNRARSPFVITCENRDYSNLQTHDSSWGAQLNHTRLHLPIGGKFFLYVNHSREVTSDKISSFSTWRNHHITMHPQK